ncbi:hypothetical protein [Pseudoalteromonas sp. OF7H-1]|uniref:hypothetical protein n=1 Tax=Pseudoalteromonas sp. OF7H-1 TaxID=2917755 RepID=UPI001EF418BA|nr:hypothetical protein [Pseudoalteromonas sp. OF7H-1]MCG7538708.1 hypothetical protein [Pseudoalteromonas sp. OF7H-1]
MKLITYLLCLCCIYLMPPQAYAQIQMAIPGPPEYSLTDSNQVNMTTGNIEINEQGVSIGSGEFALEHRLLSYSNNLKLFADNFSGALYVRHSDMPLPDVRATFGSLSESGFQAPSTTQRFVGRNGGVIEKHSDFIWKYTNSQGVEVTYDSRIHYHYEPPSSALETYRKHAVATQIKYPSGLIIKVNFKDANYDGDIIHRIQSVTSSAGYQLQYRYQLNSSSVPSHHSDKYAYYQWTRPTQIKAFVSEYEACAPLAVNCDFSNDWPEVSFSWVDPFNGGDTTITFANQAYKKFKHERFCSSGEGRTACSIGRNHLRITTISSSSSQGQAEREYQYTNTYHCTFQGTERQCQTFKLGVVYLSKYRSASWRYNYPPQQHQYSGSYSESKDSNGAVLKVVYDSHSKMVGFQDEVRGISGTYDDNGRIVSIQYNYGSPGTISQGLYRYGDMTETFTYDDHGNIIKSARTNKEGETQFYSAGYENHCNSMSTRGKPSWIKDRNGNVTYYGYDCRNGKIAIVLKPEIDGVRAEQSYYYGQIKAHIVNENPPHLSLEQGIWVKQRESFCKTGNSGQFGCAKTGDEVITMFEYSTQPKPDGLLVHGIVVSDTGNGEIRRTCFDYDIYGNKTSEIKPKANLTRCQ